MGSDKTSFDNSSKHLFLDKYLKALFFSSVPAGQILMRSVTVMYKKTWLAGKSKTFTILYIYINLFKRIFSAW